MVAVTGLVIATASPRDVRAQDKRVLDEDTQIRILPGFDAELLYEVPKSQGSWVAMAFDPKGRLIVSDQDDKGVFRVKLRDESDPNSKVQVESLKGFPFEPIKWGSERTVGGALGFLYAFDSLYMSTMKGFYRCRDTNGDDQYDEFQLLKRLGVGYEHSAHSVIKSEDGKALYLVVGNHTPVPKDVRSRQPAVWEMDSLLMPMPDPMGHAVGIKPPGGWIARISPDGKDWDMVASGFRNCVDIAINPEGELFTYDSDLEFDIGSPWYRPTRVNHVTSAGEFGWRHGTGKWQEYFADSLGAVVNIGPGSPTGMSFGHNSTFPPEFQDKLFICDWTFGTIYTVELKEDGSSYTGKHKEFLSGSPLNIAAMRFGPDGNMYFVIGGRRTQSRLYRVRYTGTPKEGEVRRLTKNQSLRDLRHSLETFHGSSSGGKGAIDKAWPYLDHEDRAIRYAARLAIENQDLSLWQDRVFAETRPRAIICAAIALSRHGDPGLGPILLKKLNEVDFGILKEPDRLDVLRAYSLCFMRLSKIGEIDRRAVVQKLDPFYPAKDDQLDAELCRLLCYLESPTVARKTVALMQATQARTLDYDKEMLGRHEYGKIILETLANSPNVQNIHYIYSLRQVSKGWTLEDRKAYFGWLNEALHRSGGKSFRGHIWAIREDAIAHLSPEETKVLESLLGEIAGADLVELPTPKGPGKTWTTKELTQLFKDPLQGRDFKNGEKMFSAGRCVTCHRIGGSGGYSGPDLGSVGSRYSIADIVDSIIEPSRTISEQYQASKIKLKSGDMLYGKIIYQNKHALAIAPSAFLPTQIQKIPSNEVESDEPSNVSMMPQGMIDGMNEDEVRDLIAYLIAGGDPRHKVFSK